ncbi:MAG: carbohydrate kinase [Deltaproteobacteria bacterium]|nr:carbohydrate kinase [Deltaproteobacteria bacterium]
MADAVVIWGEVLWDRFPDGDRLGGAPANVAWHLGQAGGWPQLVTRVGDDEDGRRAVEQLSMLVDTELVQVDPELATGEVTVRLENGEARYKLHAGRAWERIACTDEVRHALATAGVFVYGTLSQRTPAGLASWRSATAAAERCLRACDINLRPSDDQDVPAITAALEAANLVKLNDREVAAVAHWLGWKDPIATLRARGCTVAVTHGDAGSTLFGDGGVHEVAGVPAPRNPDRDNVGCGDAYLAILVHGLTQGWDLARSGRAASRWAAEVAGVRGATPAFTDDQIADLLEVV